MKNLLFLYRKLTQQINFLPALPALLHQFLTIKVPDAAGRALCYIRRMWFFLLVVALAAAAWFLLRPRLNAAVPGTAVPRSSTLSELAQWLADREAETPHLIEEAAAHVRFADPEQPAKTPLCFLYLHGFSATWPETAPVTERMAHGANANLVQARLAGHGLRANPMEATAEAWLESVQTAWHVAEQMGDRVVVVATSTGAPLAVWLATQPAVKERLHALLFMSPNFGIRSPFGFLLTAPFPRFWTRTLLGREREWEPVNEAQATFWSSRYSTAALTEMQKVVDWAGQQDLGTLRTPLAMMVMKNDPTISPDAARAAFGRWGGSPKSIIPIEIDPDEASHVFVGDITAPHRNDAVVAGFSAFLDRL